MSNKVILNAIKMEYLNGTAVYGYTISDDNDMSFDNNAEAMIEDDMELLKYVIKTADSSTKEMLDFIRDMEKGIDINDNWYDWEEIKEVLSA